MADSNIQYQQILPNFHLILNNKDRERLFFEFIFINGGSWFEKSGDRGKKHLLEHCLVDRTKEMDYKEFRDYQLAKSYNLNAYTSELNMGITLNGHYLDQTEMLNLLFNLAFKPILKQLTLDKEKEIVLKEIVERRGNPNYRLFYQVMKKIYTSDSLNNHEVLGISEDVEKTTINDLIRLQEENLKKSQLVLLVSGNIKNIENIKDKILNFVSIKNENEILPIDYEAKNKIKKFKTKVIVSNLAHENAEVSVFLPFKVDFDRAAINHIIDRMLFSYYGNIYKFLREEKKLIYSMSSYRYKSLKMLEISFTSSLEKVKEILENIKNMLENYKNQFEFNKLDIFRDNSIKQLRMEKDKPFYESNFVIDYLKGFNKIYYPDDFFKDLNKIKNINLNLILEEIKNNLNKAQILIVTKNKQAKELENWYW